MKIIFLEETGEHHEVWRKEFKNMTEFFPQQESFMWNDKRNKLSKHYKIWLSDIERWIYTMCIHMYIYIRIYKH